MTARGILSYVHKQCSCVSTRRCAANTGVTAHVNFVPFPCSPWSTIVIINYMLHIQHIPASLFSNDLFIYKSVLFLSYTFSILRAYLYFHCRHNGVCTIISHWSLLRNNNSQICISSLLLRFFDARENDHILCNWQVHITLKYTHL